MHLRIGSTAPDFKAETTHGPLSLHDHIGDDWCVLFSHPKDFTPVCTTELGTMAALIPEFAKRGCKVIGLGVDPLDSHTAWAVDIETYCSRPMSYPVIADGDLAVAKAYGMLPARERPAGAERTALQNATVRTVFVIDPHKTIRAMISYPMTCGRNFPEVLRVLDSLQLTARTELATPADWRDGDDVLLPYSWSEEDARAAYPQGWEAPLPYLRFVEQPR